MRLVAAAVLIALATTQPSLAQDAPAAFDINEYVVDGNTTLPSLDIETAVYDFLGPGKSMADVNRARESLQKAYQARGYQSVVVDLPPQQVKGGVVHLQVVENTVGRVRVEGAKYQSPQAIRDAVPSLAEGQVPNFNDAQAQLGQVNARPGRQVVPLVTPGVLPQTMDVTLKVNDTSPWRTSVEVNNDHSANTPELRTQGSVRYDNLWQAGHSASLTYIVAPQDRNAAEVYAGSYLAPLGPDWSVLVSGYKSNSNANVVGGTTVLGKGNAFGLQAIRNLNAHGSYTQSVSLGIARKHFDQNVSLGEDTSKSPITYLPISIAYNGQSTSDTSTTTVGLTGTFGMRAGGSSSADFDNLRYKARANFAYLKADLEHTFRFGTGFVLALRGTAQVSDSALVSSEQFAAGGESTVRGYLEAEDTADQGATGSIELRSPSLGSHLGDAVNDWRVHAFVDGAHLLLTNALAQPIDVNQPALGDQRVTRYELLSTGIGTRFGLFNVLTGSFEIAYPLRDGLITRAHDTRIHFSLKADL